MDQKTLTNNYHQLTKKIPQNVQLVAVSKTQPIEKIEEIYSCGQRIFGENKVQELLQKHTQLPQNIQWHLIGHLQTNKVKQIATFIDTIQSVDSEKLLEEIDKQAQKNHRIIKILLQIKIAKEDTKFGLEIETAKEIFNKIMAGKYPNIKLVGLMGMATFTENQDQIQKEFLILKNLFDEFSKQKKLETLSMGMSDDFPLAIECGANSVRIGSAIFGNRNYQI